MGESLGERRGWGAEHQDNQEPGVEAFNNRRGEGLGAEQIVGGHTVVASKKNVGQYNPRTNKS